ncbi:MAG TPA: hypothetical protein VMC80_01175 [Patescibacteria group bacterium]|nr:hypothetical protein [Patescibacteria group bacterium]
MKKRGRFFRNKLAQVWVETVIYTLIALVMIGLVLAYAKPKIEELQDRTIIEQSLSMMKDIDTTILTMGGSGNQRTLSVNIKRGDLKIDGINDRLVFEINSNYQYSEPGVPLADGNIIISTSESGSSYFTNLTRNYPDYNISYEGMNQIKTISQSATSYNFLISNKGGTPMNIDMEAS